MENADRELEFDPEECLLREEEQLRLIELGQNNLKISTQKFSKQHLEKSYHPIKIHVLKFKTQVSLSIYFDLIFYGRPRNSE